MNEDFNVKNHDYITTVTESYEHRVRRLKIRMILKRNVILVAAVAAMVYIVKKATEDFE